MASEPIITCPSCGAEIKLTESLAAPILSAAKAEFAEKLKDERKTITEEETKKAREAVKDELEGKGKELKEAQVLLDKKNEKLAEAQKAQAELLKKERELDDAKREMELTIQKRLGEELAKDREKTTKEVEEAVRLKMAEKDKVIDDQKKQLAEAQRKLEQGSQQLQGEVQELDLEQTLTAKFAQDIIEPVPKGEHGGDILHRVHSPLGQLCGTILWESKRTKNWSDLWLTKARSDQRAAKAELAVIVSEALPKGVSTFEIIDNVVVVPPSLAIPVAIILRQQLIEISNARQASEGQETKMELIYKYLTGPGFRQRVEAIVEAFSAMHDDLAKERKAITKQWAKREKQIENVMESTVGMWGDLQGIAGKTMPEIEGLEMPLLEESEAEDAEST